MKVPRNFERRGFTLVELLVVIAIIGILVALLLPAIQQAREAGRRSSCSNNIKQLALALHSYHDVANAYPINYGGNPADSYRDGRSWIALVLPNIEQTTLANQIRYGAPQDTGTRFLSDPNNTLVAKTVIKTLLCPSDGTNQAGRMDGRSDEGGTWGVTNYKAVAGANWNSGVFNNIFQSTGKWPNNSNGYEYGNGLICRNANNERNNYPTFSSITDGTSNTYAIGECVPRWCNWTWWWWWNGSTATCAIPLNYRVEQGQGFLITNATTPDNNYSFFSLHPGGGQFGMADGSTRWVNQTININLYRSLATISGAEVLPTE